MTLFDVVIIKTRHVTSMLAQPTSNEKLGPSQLEIRINQQSSLNAVFMLANGWAQRSACGQ